jgi:toxin-antitoxin system PIN domain toxin
MRCIDVNVLVYAHRVDVDHHAEYAEWLESARRGSEPLGVADLVLSGFLRVVTHPRVFRDPSRLDVALEFANELRRSPAVMPLEPAERHWHVFTELCAEVFARGNDIADAYLAALAIEHGAVLVSADRGFSRFRALRTEHPLDDA